MSYPVPKKQMEDRMIVSAKHKQTLRFQLFNRLNFFVSYMIVKTQLQHRISLLDGGRILLQ